jgi:hypothetical protein
MPSLHNSWIVLNKLVEPACQKSPIWLFKYGMMGLLQCRQHFVDYTTLILYTRVALKAREWLRELCPNGVRKGWPCNLMNAYNRQNILASLTSGFESYPSCSSPADGQHRANGKRYSTWVDVDHGMEHNCPVSIVVLWSAKTWQCHVLVHIFPVTYSKAICINHLVELVIDDAGFVYHGVTFENEKKVYDETKGVMSFSLMLPHRDKERYLRYYLLDKDWRFVQCDGQWSMLNSLCVRTTFAYKYM